MHDAGPAPRPANDPRPRAVPRGARPKENLLSPNTKIPRRRAWRLVPAAVLVVVLALLVAWIVAPEPSHRYRLVFANASQVVGGGTVRIGGTQVGTIKSIDLNDRDQAEVEISVSGDFAPLRRGASAVVRAQGSAGIASRYIDLSPGAGNEPALEDGATIDVERTTSQVDLDQIFKTIDPKTRAGLQKTIGGFSQWYEGREAEGNASAKQLPRAVVAFRKFAADVNAESAQFERLVTTSAKAMGTLSGESDRLTSLIAGAGRTVEALGSDTRSLTTALETAPPALREGTGALRELRPTTVELRRLIDATDAPSRTLQPFLRELTPVANASVPVFRQLRQLVDTPGAGNDVLDGLRDLPPLERSTRVAFPSGIKALKTSTPMLGFSRPYAPDLMAFIRSFGQSAATYDADGHYFSTAPVFDAFDFQDDANGGTLTPKAPAQRGRSAALSTGNLKRCPGSAMRLLPDRSNSFVDTGTLGNADCVPAQTPGAGR
jgi:phospholipid/cholesterol/gamma-HCH transport system substrate-binding protein